MKKKTFLFWWKFFEEDLADARRGLSNLVGVDGSSPAFFMFRLAMNFIILR